MVFVCALVALGLVRLQPDRGDIDRGKQTYVRVGCYQCHGREAQGASTGPRLGPDPLPLAAFTRDVRTPRADMPPYSIRILSDAELADIYAFVSSRPRPRKVAGNASQASEPSTGNAETAETAEQISGNSLRALRAPRSNVVFLQQDSRSFPLMPGQSSGPKTTEH